METIPLAIENLISLFKINISLMRKERKN